uniref:Uncharacterized protein n=1 Tax=Sciurus vulgaris TaxID=55149 RepID=A0A8D2D4X7_SCIVU
MQNKTKKEKEPPKPGKSGKSSKEGQDMESEISSRKNSLVAVQSSTSSKIKVPFPQPIVKKDKRQNFSRFSTSNNRELQKPPSFNDVPPADQENWQPPCQHTSGFCGKCTVCSIPVSYYRQCFLGPIHRQ